ncbi:hypothetical protein AWB83_05672 [Caballeronia ptereochthonis]|uniref:Uncharacterized protein n=1 Tax=Caballeronia ptereochthonis TaxID=1777144 RepID=A0A158DNG3_9BURK|nr:hypothetical protein AWB83_05672 [Caballeronia ptereochthonis]
MRSFSKYRWGDTARLWRHDRRVPAIRWTFSVADFPQYVARNPKRPASSQSKGDESDKRGFGRRHLSINHPATCWTGNNFDFDSVRTCGSDGTKGCQPGSWTGYVPVRPCAGLVLSSIFGEIFIAKKHRHYAKTDGDDTRRDRDGDDGGQPARVLQVEPANGNASNMSVVPNREHSGDVKAAGCKRCVLHRDVGQLNMGHRPIAFRFRASP